MLNSEDLDVLSGILSNETDMAQAVWGEADVF